MPDPRANIKIKWSATVNQTGDSIGNLSSFRLNVSGTSGTTIDWMDYTTERKDGGRTLGISVSFDVKYSYDTMGGEKSYYESYDTYIEIYASGGYNQW